jgi:hypothetical protein
MSARLQPRDAERVREVAARHAIEYGGFLSNHATHGIVALAILDAPATLIDEFVGGYAHRLETKEEPPPADGLGLTHAIERLRGRRLEFGTLVALMEKELAALRSDAARGAARGAAAGAAAASERGHEYVAGKAQRPAPLEVLIRRMLRSDLLGTGGTSGAAFHPLIHLGTCGVST